MTNNLLTTSCTKSKSAYLHTLNIRPLIIIFYCSVLSILLQEDLLEKVFYRFQHCDKNKAETVTFQQSSIEKNEFFLECTSPSSRISCDELVILTDLSPTILKPQSIVGFVQSVEVSSTSKFYRTLFKSYYKIVIAEMTRFMIRTLKSSQTETIKRAASLKLQPIGYYKAELKLVRAIDMVEDFEILELIRKPLTSKPAIDLGPSVHQYRNKVILAKFFIIHFIRIDYVYSRTN